MCGQTLLLFIVIANCTVQWIGSTWAMEEHIRFWWWSGWRYVTVSVGLRLRLTFCVTPIRTVLQLDEGRVIPTTLELMPWRQCRYMLAAHVVYDIPPMSSVHGLMNCIQYWNALFDTILTDVIYPFLLWPADWTLTVHSPVQCNIGISFQAHTRYMPKGWQVTLLQYLYQVLSTHIFSYVSIALFVFQGYTTNFNENSYFRD